MQADNPTLHSIRKKTAVDMPEAGAAPWGSDVPGQRVEGGSCSSCRLVSQVLHFWLLGRRLW